MADNLLDPYADYRRKLDARSAIAGVPGVQGEEADRRRQQNASMDEYLKKAGVGPERQMRVDPASAGQAIEQILRSPAPPAPTAAPASPLEAPRGPSYAAQAIGPAPPALFGAGAFSTPMSLPDPVIGAGINIRDSEQTQLAKMGIKRDADLAAINAMIAADRNAIAGRGVDASIFDTQTRSASDRERLGQAERFQADESRRAAEGLRSNEGIAAARERGESDRQRFQVGPEMQAAAKRAAILRAIAENPAQAQQILAALAQLDGGAPVVPAGPIPGLPPGPVQTRPVVRPPENPGEIVGGTLSMHPPPPGPPRPPWLQRNVVNPIAGVMPNLPF